MVDISFIIPVHNSAKTLERCIHSVFFNPTNKTYEIIAVDDFSSDNSFEVLNELKGHKPNNCIFETIRLEENVGVQKTRFVGLEKSQGKYVYFLDSDDEIVPEFIEKTINKMEDEKLDVLLINCDVIEEKKTSTLIAKSSFDHVRTYGAYLESLLFGDFGFTSTHVYKSTVFDHVKINELPKLSFTEDLNLYIEIVSKTDLFVGILNENLYKYYMAKNWHKSKMNVSNANDSLYVINKRYEIVKSSYSDKMNVFRRGNLKACLRLIHSVKKTKNIARKEKKLLLQQIRNAEVVQVVTNLSISEFFNLQLKDKIRYILYI